MTMKAAPNSPTMSTSRTTLWVVAGVVTILVLALTILAVQRAQSAEISDDRKVVYVIPAGTESIMVAGGDPQIVPAIMRFTLGERDILVIENHDEVGHTFGPYFVAAGDRLEVQFFRAAAYEGYCSVHPAGQVRIEVRGPWWRFW